jgi:hypothetical protein
MKHWRPCTKTGHQPKCADTLGPWGRMKLGPVREVLGWCHSPLSWCYVNGRCVINWTLHRNPCSP